jgi:glyoxylase-like metal-dependent hydrolase (beta-lactamase superfamily II)
MRLIAENCFQLEKSRGANGYVVRGEGRTAVIDPGMASGFDAVLAELRDAEARAGRITDILLTHYDVDHAQVVKRLQEALQVPVWISTADAAILRGEAAPPTRFRRFLSRMGSSGISRWRGRGHRDARDLPGAARVPDAGTHPRSPRVPLARRALHRGCRPRHETREPQAVLPAADQ